MWNSEGGSRDGEGRCFRNAGAKNWHIGWSIYYLEATRAIPKSEFISEIGIVELEADEILYWLELLEGSGMIDEEVLSDLMKESNELVAILASIGKSSKK